MRKLGLIVGALLVAAACTPAGTADDLPDGRLTVVATTTVLADLAAQVGGDRIAVHALVPPGGEVHTFDPAPSDIARVSGARLLVMNGLGLDEWLRDLADDAGSDELRVVELAEELPGVRYIEADAETDHDDGGHDDEGDDHDTEAHNPHLWLDVSYARGYVDRLHRELAELDPAGASEYAANAAAYDARLAELDGWIRQQLGQIPDDERRVVSFHDALPYFAAAYDLEIVGVVVSAPGQEPSAGEIVRLIAAIREAGVKLILAEAQFSDRLARTLADETGAVVVSELYTDSLGDPPLDSYEAAMRWNVEQIVEGMR